MRDGPSSFQVELTETALGHLEGYRAFEVNVILEAIRTQLPYQALEEARNRKLLRENPLADWELPRSEVPRVLRGRPGPAGRSRRGDWPQRA